MYFFSRLHATWFILAKQASHATVARGVASSSAINVNKLHLGTKVQPGLVSGIIQANHLSLIYIFLLNLHKIYIKCC